MTVFLSKSAFIMKKEAKLFVINKIVMVSMSSGHFVLQLAQKYSYVKRFIGN